MEERSWQQHAAGTKMSASMPQATSSALHDGSPNPVLALSAVTSAADRRDPA